MAHLALVIALALAAQSDDRTPAEFARRAAELDAVTAKRAAAATAADRAALTLDWLRRLRSVLRAIPFERRDGPHHAWLAANDSLVIYSEPAGEWLIGQDVLAGAYREHAQSGAADEIAWLAADNGLPGECEGYVPCYAATLDMLYGEYLRRRPQGSHRQEAYDRINESLRIVVDDLLTRKQREDFLNVPRDCDDLLKSTGPLRSAVAKAGGNNTDTVTLLDRLIKWCPPR